MTDCFPHLDGKQRRNLCSCNSRYEVEVFNDEMVQDKEVKGIQIIKEVKWFLFADGMIST